MNSLLRSLLFVPGSRPDRFAKAIDCGADAVVFDLEDSVEASRKADARRDIKAFLASAPDGVLSRLVRVNAPDSPWFAADLAWVADLTGVDGVLLPKAESPRHVEDLARACAPRPVMPILESARGVLGAAAIAQADAPVPALLFGAEDLTAQLGVPRTLTGEELIVARSQVALAAATTGAQAIDAVFVDVSDADGLRRDAERARALGFSGKMAIHPRQVDVIHVVFTPSAAEVQGARALVAAYEAARARGEGVIRVDDRMIDVPVYERARRLAARADAIAARTSRTRS